MPVCVCVFKRYKAVRLTQCTEDQPGDYAHCLCSLLNVYVCFSAKICMCLNVCVCLKVCTCVCTRLSVCARAGHPEAARPDVPESGLCRVMSGSLADSADFEQCTQVSPANELSI